MAAVAAPLTGQPASDLLDLLRQAGAFVDCEMGSCGTQAEKVQCVLQKAPLEFRCSLLVQDAKGDLSPMKIQGQPAQSLYEVLHNNGGKPVCQKKKCVLSAKLIECHAIEETDYACNLSL